MTLTHTLAAIAVAATLTAAAAPETSGARHFDVGRFDAVELAASDDVRVVPGTAFTVVATGDPRAVAALAVAVRGDTLRVGRLPGSYRDKGVLVTVTMPSLRAVSVTGSGGLTASNLGGPRFTASLSGSGRIVLAGLRTGAARLDLSGSGSIVADGQAGTVAINLDGSGDVDTRRLTTPDVAIDFGGSGDVTAAASRSARIRASGSGGVRVTGNPHCAVTATGTARITCG